MIFPTLGDRIFIMELARGSFQDENSVPSCKKYHPLAHASKNLYILSNLRTGSDLHILQLIVPPKIAICLQIQSNWWNRFLAQIACTSKILQKYAATSIIIVLYTTFFLSHFSIVFTIFLAPPLIIYPPSPTRFLFFPCLYFHNLSHERQKRTLAVSRWAFFAYNSQNNTCSVINKHASKAVHSKYWI